MKTYLFSDIDGTFLQGHFLSKKRKQFKPTDTLVKSVHEFVSEGNQLIFATGRRRRSIRRLEKNIGFKPNFAISMNGAIVHGPDDTELRRVEIDKAVVEELMNLLKEAHLLRKLVMFTSYMDAKNIVNTHRKPQFFFRFLAKKFSGMIHHDIQTEIESGNHNLIKFVVIGNKKLIEKTRKLVEDTELPLELFKSSPYSLEFCAKGANKGDALKFVLDFAKARDVQTAYVGDSENDISGFKAVDLPFAIEGGEPTIFQHANYRVKTVEEAISVIKNTK